MSRQALEPEQKALEINLDDKIYGTFSEIGAGQEVARYFFQVGAAAGTIAKTMSAYDKVYSDAIYGTETSGRYVCEARIYKMLDHEYDLMISRLRQERPGTNFFAFADTVAAINYQRTIRGDGWLGLRFQLQPDGEPNDIALHVKMLDGNSNLQQQAIGILGVNLIYACFRYHHDPEMLVVSLMDSLRERINIDMIQIKGPNFAKLDNRLLSLWLVKHNMSDVAMFNADKKNVHPSELLYKKNLLIVRGSFRPVTHVNWDMINSSREQFRHEPNLENRASYLLTEITLDNLQSDGDLDESDFLDRSDVLCALGQTVVVSNCEKYHRLIHYFADYRIGKICIVIGAKELLNVLNEKHYQNSTNSMLSAFGELFTNNMKMYVYPALQEGSGELMNTRNLPIQQEIRFIYEYLLDHKHIEDVHTFNTDNLHIFSKEVLRMIQADESGWERLVPPKVAQLIREKCLFNFPCQSMEFEY